MTTVNPFDLLGDDAEDPSHQIEAEQLKAAAAAAAAPKKGQPPQGKTAQLPTKPPPPAQAVREARTEPYRGGRGGGRGGGGRGYGRSRGGFSRDSSNDENTFGATEAPANKGAFGGDAEKPSERQGYGAPRAPYRVGGRFGGFSNGEGDEEGRPRRVFERRSGTGRGNEFKREGSGRGNWGTQSDEIARVSDEIANESEKNLADEKSAAKEDAAADANKESPVNETEEKEPEDKEMTLEEYEKLLEEKRKALQALKTEQRKVDTKEFESMQPLASKKDNHEIFAKLGSDKDKRKEALEKEEKSKKKCRWRLTGHKFLYCSLLMSLPMEGLKVSKASLIVYIHPSKSRDVSQALLRELSSLLFTYNESFDGVVLAYDVNSMDKCAKILPGVHPYFGVNLKVNLLLFSPKPDMHLEGKVVKLTQESIHVVVLGFSSAIITEKFIRDDLVYKTKRGQDVYASKSHKRHVIKVGSFIRFLVKSFDEEILHICGSLDTDHTGSINWLDKNLEVFSHTNRSAKKRESESVPMILEQAVSGERSTVDAVQKIKTSKKLKIRQES